MDVVVIGINGSKKDFEEWKSLLNISLKIAVDVDGISKMRYAIYSLPAIYRISSGGLVKMIHTGFRPGDDVKFETLFKDRVKRVKQRNISG